MAARPLLIGVVAIVAFAVGAIVARSLLDPVPAAATPEHATLYPQPRPVPVLDLVDQDGMPLAADFFRQGWTLAFFGFTRCPDVCPTTLAVLAKTRRALGDLPPAVQPRVLLLSVDPEHDDPATLARYVRYFDPAFLAATGAPTAVAAMAAGFGVPVARVALGNGDYTVDHGAGVFIVAPEGIVAYSGAPQEAGVLARDYRLVVAQRGVAR
jgi:protein SCO1/2